VVNELTRRRSAAKPASGAVAEAVRDEERFFEELLPVSGLDSEVALNIVRAGHFLESAFSANARTHGLSDAQVHVMVAVEDLSDGLTMAQIARRMLVSRAGVLGVVRGLEGRGWVTTRKCPDDARALRVRITPDGQAVLDTMLPAHLRLVHDLVGECFTKPQKEELVRLLTRLRAHMATRRATGRTGTISTRPTQGRRRR
jgi:MarR family 2-MHQ and catechol resistance regulon transcriptional repressor